MPEAESVDNYAPIGVNLDASDLITLAELSMLKYASSQKSWYNGIADGNLKRGVGLVTTLAEKYADFAESHPTLARYVLDIYSVTVKTLAGAIAGATQGGLAGGVAGAGAGFAGGLAQAASGEAIDKIAGELIRDLMKEGVEGSVPVLMKADSSLTKDEATLLARALLIGFLTTKDLSDGLKTIARSIKVNPKMAVAGGAELDDVSINANKLHKEPHVDGGGNKVDDIGRETFKHYPKNQRPIDVLKVVEKVDDSLKLKTAELLELDNEILKDVRAGKFARRDFQEHHMVTPEVRNLKNHPIWDLSGIDVEDPINKILLPTKREFHPTRSIHSGAHTAANRERILFELDRVRREGIQNNWSQGQFRTSFQEILLKERQGLVDGTINLYQKQGN